MKYATDAMKEARIHDFVASVCSKSFIFSYLIEFVKL